MPTADASGNSRIAGGALLDEDAADFLAVDQDVVGPI